MQFILLAAITAFLAAPQFAYEQGVADNPPPKEEKITVPEILEKIAYCESEGKHFDEKGEVVLGRNKHDIGKYQINALYWKELADKLGYDIYTEEGNRAMALELYHRFGTDPWKSSKRCWNKNNGKV